MKEERCVWIFNYCIDEINNNNNNNNNIYSHVIHIQVSHILFAKQTEQIYYFVRNGRQWGISLYTMVYCHQILVTKIQKEKRQVEKVCVKHHS